jgi:hypothetical protein
MVILYATARRVDERESDSDTDAGRRADKRESEKHDRDKGRRA